MAIENSLFAIYGVSGHGRETMPLARMMLARQGGEANLVFLDDNSTLQVVNGRPVLTYQQFLSTDVGERHVSVAIADSVTREKLVDRCAADGILFFSVIAGNVVIMDNVEIGEGCILSPFVTLTSDIKIGRHFHANIYSSVSHDCVIGDYVTFAPGVRCNGNVVIEDHAYIGAGAILRQGKPGQPLIIGKGAIVGMGAVVTKNVPPGCTVVGNPARPLVKG